MVDGAWCLSLLSSVDADRCCRVLLAVRYCCAASGSTNWDSRLMRDPGKGCPKQLRKSG